MSWSTPNSRTWLRGEYSITLLGKYFVSAYLGSTIGLHTDLASAQLDCTLHYRNRRRYPMADRSGPRKVYTGKYTMLVTGTISTLAHDELEAEKKIRTMLDTGNWGMEGEKPFSSMSGGIDTEDNIDLELPEEDSYQFIPGSVEENSNHCDIEDHGEYDPDGEDKEEIDEEEESETEDADFDDSDHQRSAG